MKFLTTSVGRLRLISFAEGLSLLFLLFVSMPLKYWLGFKELNSNIGALHGVLFILFIFITLQVAFEEKWKFRSTTWKVLVACVIPFGTFYIDRMILKPIYECDKS